MKNLKTNDGPKSSLLKAVALAFLVTVFLCVGLLWGTAVIPQSMIQKNCAKSAAYFQEQELFPMIVDGQFHTRQDNYADCILLNIIYNIGQKDESLFASWVKASYYCLEDQNVNEGFAASVADNPEANVDYFRYWHGSMVLLRPLLMVFDIVQVRLILGLCAHLLMLFTAVILWKKKRKSLAVCSLAAMFFINSWVTAFCVEYVTTFLVMGAACLWVAVTWKEDRDCLVRRRRFLCLMAVCGVSTCFLDFLTTETLTVTMPLFLELALGLGEKTEKRYGKAEFLFMVQSGLVWGLSYALMFLLKWILAAWVLGISAMKEALEYAGERVSGAVYLGNTNLDPQADLLERLFGALFRNEGMLFYFKDELNIIICAFLFLLLVLAGASVVYLFHTKKLHLRTMRIFLLLGCVPYLRFFALSNHAYQHYFFTYRAQMVTVGILCYLVWEYGLCNLSAAKRTLHKKSKRKK
ncbi:MAG: hypothetical protein IJ390_09480 [Lachnospiraceae bacterium]|nr:hypothetical protein [Lachnospiraceae bacterium]